MVMFKKLCHALVLFSALILVSFQATASTISLLENTTFVRTKEKSKIETVQFSYLEGKPFQLAIFNGDENKQYCRVLSAVIALNGKTFFSQSEFNQQAFKLSTDINFQEDNTFSVKLNSKSPCGKFSLPLAITPFPNTKIIRDELYQYTITTNIPLYWSNAFVELNTAPERMSVANGTMA
jgi:hypothetical protein